MGKVWRARHATLHRDDALKVLPEAFAADPDRLARFRREAQVLASLNHPHIAHVYGFEQATPSTDSGQAIQALVMELVEGPTLADRIAQGPIPVDEALAIATQIAEALEAAHEQGIVHRDLKPANIKVRSDGTVKVLDFGLAKAVAPGGGGGAGMTNSPTLSLAATQAGVILGTAAYMSPEQARGREANRRCDIWAFGCVLYEMLTGRRAFVGADVADTLAAVLRGAPDWDALPASTPMGVRRMLRRCLERDPGRRLRDIGDVAILIEDLATPAPAAQGVAGASSRARLAVWVLGGLLAASLVALGVAYRPLPAAETRVVRFTVEPQSGVTISVGSGQTFALSPDGRRIVMVAARNGQTALWVRNLDSLEAQPIPGTEGNVLTPFWSPDGLSVGFFLNGSLKTVGIAGGPVRTVCDAPGTGRGGAWNEEGTIVFASSARPGLFAVPARGGESRQVAGAASLPGSHPSFLPDGRRFMFLAANKISLGSLDSAEVRDMLDSDSQAQFVPPDLLLFVREETLFAQRFDVQNGVPSGDPLVVADGMTVDAIGHSRFSAAGDGSLAYRSAGTSEVSRLTWFDRAGRMLGAAGPPGRYRNPALSPDGTRVAVVYVREGDRNRDVWMLDLPRDVLSRFTFDPADDASPVWAPDGSRVAFGSSRLGGMFSLFQKAASGSTPEVLLFKSTVEEAQPYSWSPDGRFILHRYMNNGAFNTGILEVGRDEKPRLYQATPFTQSQSQASPDGRWMAFHSNESGANEVFAQTFPEPGGRWQISRSGGFFPRWRRDGREIFYYAPDSQLMAVPVGVSGSSLEFGSPMPLFRVDMLNGPATAVGFRAQYDVAPDGQRFLVNVPTGPSAGTPLTVVLNWAARLGQAR
jgi:Tol biopolymer transport system component